jgi:hypothetical protein
VFVERECKRREKQELQRERFWEMKYRVENNTELREEKRVERESRRERKGETFPARVCTRGLIIGLLSRT